MLYLVLSETPLGPLVLTGDGGALTGLWRAEASPYALPAQARPAPQDPLLVRGAQWVRAYFGGEQPDPAALPLAPRGTPFQRQVWAQARQIPYGARVTYGDLARELGRPQAARAVGAALGRNPILLFIPCHRVVGVGGALTGFAAGVEAKQWLLDFEAATR